MTVDIVALDKEPALIMDDDSTTESCDEKPQPVDNMCSTPNRCQSAENSNPSCAHLKKCVDFSSIKKTLKTSGLENKTCQDCAKETSTSAAGPTNGSTLDSSLIPPQGIDDSSDALWMCLRCGVQLCRQGANQNMHVLLHFQKPRSEPHAMFVNTATFNVWCFLCKQFVDTGHRKKLMECIEYLKKDAKKVTTNLKQQHQSQQQSTVKATEKTTTTTTTTTMANSDSGTSVKSTTSPTVSAGPATGVASPSNNYQVLRTGQGRTVNRAINHDLIALDSLPRVRGLSNLGNTCFFNAVLQCLAQTPYLSSVLQESSVAGEYVELPGGKLQLNEKDENDAVDLPPISGNLVCWSSLTATLSETIDELGSGSGSVHNPRKLLNQLTNKWPQFGDGDQHDSHELLRHLLESVRNEDLRRYQTLILHALGYNTKVDPQKVQGDVKKKIKFYGQQASDRILRPEQVFRGFLVSTLMCQDCHHTSSRHENFLDISLPVSQDKPQPPVRRKGSPEPTAHDALIALPMANDDTFAQSPATSSKHQLKKERKRDKKMKRMSRKQKMDRNGNVDTAGGDLAEEEEESPEGVAENGQSVGEDKKKKGGSSGGDNNGDEGAVGEEGADNDEDGNEDDDDDDEEEDDTDADEEDNCQEEGDTTKVLGNGMVGLDIAEKQDDTPENPNKGDFDAKNMEVEVGISGSGATNLVQSIEQQQQTQSKSRQRNNRQRTTSYSDWSTTIAPRYQCDEGECSVQSCLNNFTAIELMTGNNKVGCEACTERVNGKDGKSVNTNATKQFLISSPPAVLILHLKRFQMGARFMFRKLTRHVTFPFLLDIAPFCGTKVKRLPNVDRRQKKLLYSLYGIVEHSGGMHGGHYVAYVKVRPQMSKEDIRWKFIPQGSKAELDQTDEQRVRIEEALAKARERMENDSDDALSQSSSSSEVNEEEGAVGGTTSASAAAGGSGGLGDESIDKEADKVVPPPGKWYYVSDSRVTEVSEDAVLKAQAYLLFYERIY